MTERFLLYHLMYSLDAGVFLRQNHKKYKIIRHRASGLFSSTRRASACSSRISL